MDNTRILNNKHAINEERKKFTDEISLMDPGVKKIPKVLLPLNELLSLINKKNSWTLKSGNAMLDSLYQYQKIAFEKNDKKTSDQLEFYIKYVKHQIEYLNAFQDHLLTLVATIFLPLTFLTGFFGMNFKSMGAPSLKNGIFNIKHADKLMWLYSFLLFIIITLLYFNVFKVI